MVEQYQLAPVLGIQAKYRSNQQTLMRHLQWHQRFFSKTAVHQSQSCRAKALQCFAATYAVSMTCARRYTDAA